MFASHPLLNRIYLLKLSVCVCVLLCCLLSMEGLTKTNRKKNEHNKTYFKYCNTLRVSALPTFILHEQARKRKSNVSLFETLQIYSAKRRFTLCERKVVKFEM